MVFSSLCVFADLQLSIEIIPKENVGTVPELEFASNVQV